MGQPSSSVSNSVDTKRSPEAYISDLPGGGTEASIPGATLGEPLSQVTIKNTEQKQNCVTQRLATKTVSGRPAPTTPGASYRGRASALSSDLLSQDRPWRPLPRWGSRRHTPRASPRRFAHQRGSWRLLLGLCFQDPGVQEKGQRDCTGPSGLPLPSLLIAQLQ